jgi:hypothetical protein
MQFRHLFAAALLAAVAGISACSSPTQPTASLPNESDNLVVYSLTGSPPAFPTGLDFAGRRVVRPGLRSDGAPNFDLAFDARTAGQVTIYPAKLVVQALRTPTVGVRVATESSFDAIHAAPTTGYVTDSSVVVSVGKPFIIETLSLSCSFGEFNYAKLVVDSVGTAGGVYVRMLLNPSCGYRSLDPGFPKN